MDSSARVSCRRVERNSQKHELQISHVEASCTCVKQTGGLPSAITLHTCDRQMFLGVAVFWLSLMAGDCLTNLPRSFAVHNENDSIPTLRCLCG
jgi:hypothetical protein